VLKASSLKTGHKRETRCELLADQTQAEYEMTVRYSFFAFSFSCFIGLAGDGAGWHLKDSGTGL